MSGLGLGLFILVERFNLEGQRKNVPRQRQRIEKEYRRRQGEGEEDEDR